MFGFNKKEVTETQTDTPKEENHCQECKEHNPEYKLGLCLDCYVELFK